MTDVFNNNQPDEPDEPEMANCHFCNDSHPVDEMTERELSRRHGRAEVHLCASCDDDTITCVYCNEPTLSVDSVFVDTAEDLLCEYCGNRYTSFCRDHEIRYYDDDGCTGCEYDREQEEYEDSSLIHSYGYKPSPFFYASSKDSISPKSLRTFTGFELEMEASACDTYEGAELANDIFGPWTYLKHDGSLNDGFEMVSHPLGYDFVMNNFPWQKLKELSQLGMRSANTRTCGLHIHINRNFFDTAPTTMYRFMSMFYRNAEQWKRIAGRAESTYATWSEYELANMARYAKNYREHDYNRERYVAINLQNRNTLELRFFKGTLRPETFIARIEAAHAVAHYAYDTRNRVSIKSAHDWERFREWTIANKYNAFDAYATSKGV